MAIDRKKTAKKGNNVKPTAKQKKAVMNISENLRSKGEALKEAGYSDIVCKSPTIVTESKGFKIASEPIIKKMEKAREKAMDRLLKTTDEATHSDSARTVDLMTKNIQLLGGKPTEIVAPSNEQVKKASELIDSFLKGEDK